MKKIVHSSTKYVINGREYNSLEEMPEQDRQFFVDANRNGIPDGIEKIISEAGIPSVQTQQYEVQHKEIVVDSVSGGRLSDPQGLLNPSDAESVPSLRQPTSRNDPWVVSINLKTALVLLILAAVAALVIYLFS